VSTSRTWVVLADDDVLLREDWRACWAARASRSSAKPARPPSWSSSSGRCFPTSRSSTSGWRPLTRRKASMPPGAALSAHLTANWSPDGPSSGW